MPYDQKPFLKNDNSLYKYNSKNKENQSVSEIFTLCRYSVQPRRAFVFFCELNQTLTVTLSSGKFKLACVPLTLFFGHYAQ